MLWQPVITCHSPERRSLLLCLKLSTLPITSCRKLARRAWGRSVQHLSSCFLFCPFILQTSCRSELFSIFPNLLYWTKNPRCVCLLVLLIKRISVWYHAHTHTKLQFLLSEPWPTVTVFVNQEYRHRSSAMMRASEDQTTTWLSFISLLRYPFSFLFLRYILFPLSLLH